MPVEGIESIAQNPSWLDKELQKLRGRTVFLFLFSLFFGGLILGYFLVGDLFLNFTDPVKKVSYAYVGESNLKVNVETKEPVTAKVEYGPSEEVLNEKDVGDYETNHSIKLEGLLPQKPHIFRLIINDSAGNVHKSDFFVAE